LGANILTGLLDEYSTLLLFHFFLVLSVVYCSARLPALNLSPKNISVKQKGIGKKFLWLFTASVLITSVTFLLLYFNEVQAQKGAVKLNPVGGRVIEFPNIVDDMDRDLYIPFRCQFPEEKVRVKFFRYCQGKRESINRRIDEQKDASLAAKISLTGDGDFIWIDGGSVDVNIPVSGNCVSDGRVKLLIALYDGSTEKYTVPYEFEALAPIPEARNSWTISSRVTHSEMRPGSTLKLFVDAVNHGQEGAFEFILNILDPDTQDPVPREVYAIANPVDDTFTIQHGSRYQYEWRISFKETGIYLLNTCAKKHIRYLDMPVNREKWGDSYNYQNLFVAVTDSESEIEDGSAMGGIVSPTETVVAVYGDFQGEAESVEAVRAFETETRRSGAALYDAPSSKSNVVATNIRKGARVIVFGRGSDASEIIANSDRYVRTEVVKLKRTGYMKKQILSSIDSPPY